MRITGLETIRSPLQPNVCHVLVHTSDRYTGVGETFWGAAAVEAYLHDAVAPVLVGLENPAPARVARLLAPYVGYAGSGVEVRGNGAIDMALWDILGKRAGVPVADLLGGPLATSMRTYNTCAGDEYIKGEGQQPNNNRGISAIAAPSPPYEDLQQFLRDPAGLARSLLDEGITAMKVWPFDEAAERGSGVDISTADLRAAMTPLEAIRSELGNDMDLLIEMHGLWSLRGATQILHALESISPFWVEDPIRPDGVDAFRALRDRVKVPIAAGETATGRRAFLPLIASGAIDVAIVDICWTGGLTEAVKIAGLADTYGVAVAPHDCTGPVTLAACAHFAMSQPNTLIAESVRAFRAGWYTKIAAGFPAVYQGNLALPSAPGLGVELLPEYLGGAHGATRRQS